MFKLTGQQSLKTDAQRPRFRLVFTVLISAMVLMPFSSSTVAAATSEESVSAIASLNAGTAAIQSGRALEAIDYLNSAIESNALSVEGIALAYHHRAIAHQKLGLSGHAVADYTSAIWQGGLPAIVVPRSYYNRAVAYAQMGQQDRAARDYDKAIELAPDYAAAYHNRGNLRRHMEQYVASVSDYSRALELGMERQAHLTHFARALSYNAMGNREASLQDTAQAIELKPDFTVAKDALAEWGGAPASNVSVAQVREVIAEPIVTGSIASERTTPAVAIQQVQIAQVPERVALPAPVSAPVQVAAARTPLPELDAVRIPSNVSAHRPVTLTPPDVAAIEPQSGSVTVTPLSQALPAARAADGWEATVTRFARPETTGQVAFARTPAVPVISGLTTASIAPGRGIPALRSSNPLSRPRVARTQAPQPIQVAQNDTTTTSDAGPGVAQPNLRVQVGSFRTAAEATSAWDKVSGAHRALIGQRQPYIVEADLGARGIYYRLQMGPFGSKSEVTAFCRALKIQGQDCIPAL